VRTNAYSAVDDVVVMVPTLPEKLPMLVKSEEVGTVAIMVNSTEVYALPTSVRAERACTSEVARVIT